MDNLKITIAKTTEIWRGMSAYGAKNPERPYNSLEPLTEYHRKLLNGGNIGRYNINWEGEYIKYGDWLHRPRPVYIYDNPKILIQRIRNPKLKKRIIASSDFDKYISSDGLTNILLKDEFINDLPINNLLGILNSKLINFWFSYYFFDVNIKPEQIRQIPLIDLDILKVSKIGEIVEKRVDDGVILVITTDKFIKYLNSKFQLEKLTKKLQNWHELEFGDFIKELNKAIKTSNKQRLKDGLQEVPELTKKDEFEWLDLFEENKEKAQTLQTQITQTDKEIDAMVYELYGLTEGEIKIVENS
jgi:hypothetical protein